MGENWRDKRDEDLTADDLEDMKAAAKAVSVEGPIAQTWATEDGFMRFQVAGIVRMITVPTFAGEPMKRLA